MKKPLVIFDLDGTVIESDGNLMACINYALERSGFSLITRERLQPLIGHPLDHVFRVLVEENGAVPFNRVIEELEKDFKYYSDENLIEDTVIYEGIPEILNLLSGKRFLKAIGTTKPSDKASEILEALELLSAFDHVQGTDGFPYKPAPDIIFAIQEHFQKQGYSLSHTFMVGDTMLDIEAGKNAGVTTILVNYGFNFHKNETGPVKADFLASTPEEIFQFIEDRISSG